MKIGETYELRLHGEETAKMYKLINQERGFYIFVDIESGDKIVARLSSFEKINESR